MKPDPHVDTFADVELSPPELAMAHDLRDLYQLPQVAPIPPIDWQQPPAMPDLRATPQHGASPPLRPSHVWHRHDAGSVGDRRRRSWIPAIAAAAAVVLLAVVLHSFTQPAAGPNVDIPGRYLVLRGVSLTGPNEGWAVGGATWIGPDHPGPGAVLIAHLHNGVWSQQMIPINFPGFPDAQYPILNSVSMVNDHDGWAVGATTLGSLIGFWMHYDGTAWRLVLPTPDNATEVTQTSDGHTYLAAGLSQVQMFSATDGWAAANEAGRPGYMGLYHYTGATGTGPSAGSGPSTWASIPTAMPCNGLPANLSQPYTQNPRCAITAMRMVTSGTNLAAAEGWIGEEDGGRGSVGTLNGPTTYFDTTLARLYHLVAGQWQLELTLPYSTVLAVDMRADGEGWAVVATHDPETSAQTAHSDPTHLILYQRASGVWRKDQALTDIDPLALSSATLTLTGGSGPSATESGWLAVKSAQFSLNDHTSYGFTTALYQLQQGVWQRITLPTLANRNGLEIDGFAFAPTAGSGAMTTGLAVGMADWPDDGSIPDPHHLGFSRSGTPLILRFDGASWSIVSD